MQSIITVEYDNVEEEVRCIRWAAGKTRLALVKYWSSCLIAGLGIAGFSFDGLRKFPTQVQRSTLWKRK